MFESRSDMIRKIRDFFDIGVRVKMKWPVTSKATDPFMKVSLDELTNPLVLRYIQVLVCFRT